MPIGLHRQTGNPLLKPSVTHDITAVGVWRFLRAMIKLRSPSGLYPLLAGTQVENQSVTTLINYINHNRLPSLTVMLGSFAYLLVYGIFNASANCDEAVVLVGCCARRRTYNNPLFVGSLNNTFTLPAGFLLSAEFNYQSRRSGSEYHP